MLDVDEWAEIRRLHRAEGMGIKAIVRKLGVARNTVRAALRSDAAPKYVREAPGSAVDAFEPAIRRLLATTPDMPATAVAERIGWTRGITVLGALSTVFGAAALAPGRVTVTPQTGLEDGQAVQVALTGFPPGARVQLTQCVPPGQPVAERCGAPGPVVPLAVREDGRASATFRVRAGSVGSDHHPCQRGRVCALAVITEDGAVRAPVVPITFSAGRGASYDGGRLTVGLLVATVLAGLATWLVRTTDWREPSEAATPELDAASFGDL